MLGLLSALATAVLAEDCGGPAGPTCDGECTLTVSLNGSGAVVLAGKPPFDRYYVSPGGGIAWKFVNNTGVAISVRLNRWEDDSEGNCPVAFKMGGGPGRCEAFLPTIKNGEAGVITADAQGAEDDPNNPFDFDVAIGKDGEAPRPIDPELQIDDFQRSLVAALLALLSAIFFFASWWTGRRRPRKL
jgi:hypothetical protein